MIPHDWSQTIQTRLRHWHGGIPNDVTAKRWVLYAATTMLVWFNVHGLSHLWAHRGDLLGDGWSVVFLAALVLLLAFVLWAWRTWRTEQRFGAMPLQNDPEPLRLGQSISLSFRMRQPHADQPFTARLVCERGRMDSTQPSETLFDETVIAQHRAVIDGETVTMHFDLHDAAALSPSYTQGDDVCSWVLQVQGMVTHAGQTYPIQRVWSVPVEATI